MDDKFHWDLIPEFKKGERFSRHNLIATDIFVRLNKAQLTDDFMQLEGEQHLEFYQVEDEKAFLSSFEDSANVLLAIFVRFDKKYSIYERR